MCETSGRLDGKVAVVTGGSSGIGFEAAKDLAYLGARVVIASRNESKLMRAAKRIHTVTGNHNVTYKLLDLSSLASVRNFVNEINNEGKLNVLVNNAGALGLSDHLSKDGLNLTMQINFFGTFLLTYLLLPLLKSSSPSRIINGVAAAMYIGHLEFDHWNDIGRYTSVEAMANSKLATDLFTAELSRRLKDKGVTANTYDPYVVKDTDILNDVDGIMHDVSKLFVDLVGQPKEEVGRQIAYLAAEPSMEDVSGRHFKFCRQWINHWLADEKELTKQLWNESKRVVNVTLDEDWEIRGED